MEFLGQIDRLNIIVHITNIGVGGGGQSAKISNHFLKTTFSNNF